MQKVRSLRPVTARDAYDSFAPYYDNWNWQEFWRRNEWPLVAEFIDSAPKARAILDVGTGTGYYLGKLMQPSRLLCGLDISYNMLRVARKRIGDGAFLVQADATAIPFAPNRFDIVLLNRVGSHLEDVKQLVGEIARLLSRSGRLIVSDLAPEHTYSCTEFEAPHNKVLVETHKHGIGDWQRAGVSRGLQMVRSRLITAHNAAWLPTSGFTSIDRRGTRPVGFVAAFDCA